MKCYHVNAFANAPDGGNPAGVVICENGAFPSDATMQNFASKIGFSETAYVANVRGQIHIRYFTPQCEVDLCGHATIATFKALLEAGLVVAGGDYEAETKSGRINVKVEPRFISMTMASARVLSTVKEQNSLKLIYGALGTEYAPVKFMPACGTFMNLDPMVVTAGVPFLVVPIDGVDTLNSLKPDLGIINEISKALHCSGIYAFAFETKDIGTMAHCRGFYPFLGINEECATGTGVAALSFYLNGFGLFGHGREAKFIQGEAMGRKSELTAYIKKEPGSLHGIQILVGGNAAVVMQKDVEL